PEQKPVDPHRRVAGRGVATGVLAVVDGVAGHAALVGHAGADAGRYFLRRATGQLAPDLAGLAGAHDVAGVVGEAGRGPGRHGVLALEGALLALPARVGGHGAHDVAAVAGEAVGEVRA